MNIVDSLTQKIFEIDGSDQLQLALYKNMSLDSYKDSIELLVIDLELKEVVQELEVLKPKVKCDSSSNLSCTYKKSLVSILQASQLELKQLPNHLKYAFLKYGDTLPMIISCNLTLGEEKKLVETLKKYTEAIGWTIADIKGLSSSTCMHKILLKEWSKSTREAQRMIEPSYDGGDLERNF